MLLPALKVVVGCCGCMVCLSTPIAICAPSIYCWPGYAVPVAVGESLAVGEALASEVVGDAAGCWVLVFAEVCAVFGEAFPCEPDNPMMATSPSSIAPRRTHRPATINRRR